MHTHFQSCFGSQLFIIQQAAALGFIRSCSFLRVFYVSWIVWNVRSWFGIHDWFFGREILGFGPKPFPIRCDFLLFRLVVCDLLTLFVMYVSDTFLTVPLEQISSVASRDAGHVFGSVCSTRSVVLFFPQKKQGPVLWWRIRKGTKRSQEPLTYSCEADHYPKKNEHWTRL